MPWLLRDGEVLAGVELPATRRRGNDAEGAVLLSKARAVHTLGTKDPIDVAWCRLDEDGYVVIEIKAMRRWRVTRPRFRAGAVITARWGAFDAWRLAVGDRLEVR
jgi:uncharacterized membrane protein (UPF0127 family)